MAPRWRRDGDEWHSDGDEITPRLRRHPTAQEFRERRLDEKIEEAELHWRRWAALFEKKEDGSMAPISAAADIYASIIYSEAGRIWLERLLDALGAALKVAEGETGCDWAQMVKLLHGSGWRDTEDAPYMARVRRERAKAEPSRAARAERRRALVARYRMMMRQLRDNQRFVDEERRKLQARGQQLQE